VSVDVAGC